MPNLPSYLDLYETGELARRTENARQIMRHCTLCPWNCRVNRLEGEVGFCRTGSQPMVSGSGPHFGEEPPLVGKRGSGTIFFTGCNLRCVFCQNYDISHLMQGEEISARELGEVMVTLWRQGCHNLNFVTPSHQVFQILEALPYAIAEGVNIPLVYNCGGYESVETLQLLEGIFDIYLPDFKYGDSATAQRFSGPADYVERARSALREMQRQVGALCFDDRGGAVRGLLVRHLVLSGGLSGSAEVLEFIAREISADTWVNLMDQYRPCFEAHQYPPLNRPISQAEYSEAVNLARKAGLCRLGEG